MLEDSSIAHDVYYILNTVPVVKLISYDILYIYIYIYTLHLLTWHYGRNNSHEEFISYESVKLIKLRKRSDTECLLLIKANGITVIN